MKTIAIDSKKEITFSAFKNRDNDVFEIKIRVQNQETLEKTGCILEIPIELLNLLSNVPPGKSYPRFQLADLIKQ